jgi:hypothetical protein
MGIAGTAMQKQKEGRDKRVEEENAWRSYAFLFFWHRFRSSIVSWMGSETLLLFLVALFNNSHNERSNYHG